MKNEKNFWRDIEADDKALAKVDKMIERKDRKEFEAWDKKQKKDPEFWRREKNNKSDWL